MRRNLKSDRVTSGSISIRSALHKNISPFQVKEYPVVYKVMKLPPLFLATQLSLKQELAAVLVDNHCAAFRIQEKVFTLGDVSGLNATRMAVDTRQDARRSEQLQSISQADLAAVLGDLIQGRISDNETFRLRTEPDDGLDLVGAVRGGGDNEETREKIRWDSVGGADVVSAPDDCVAAV